jgi:bifunctional enzyme CysN/CysC
MIDSLKFITCGSVDDGKSTLIGHLLYDAKLLFSDQEKALELESKVGSNDGDIDYSLLLDGLMAEREQGITIDVAYRYFITDHRSFIVADTPGHEQYTRNMAVGASFADVAVILVDASQGILIQTKRHARICSLMGIKHFVLAVNKMDLIAYDEHRFNEIKEEFLREVANLDLDTISVIPVSATEGDNIVNRSQHTSWYTGETLIRYLETIDVSIKSKQSGFLMSVQRVSRPNHKFRGFQGQVEVGEISVGDEIISFPSEEKACVKSIFIGNKDCTTVSAGQPANIQLDSEIDVSRGCVLVRDVAVELADMFTAEILWMDDAELGVGRNYVLKLGTKVVPATLMKIKHKIDINTGKHISADKLLKNELAICDLSLAENIVFDSFTNSKGLGSFILMDRITNMTSACGVIKHALRRSTNVVWQDTDVTQKIRANQKNQRPITIWFTGLSGSGKSTLANELEKRLVAMGKHTMLLDGDNVRHGLNKNLGFKPQDRVENIRRIAEVSKLMNEAGLIVITSFISPYQEDRQSAREVIGEDSFVEIYVSTSVEECERRDVKGLYKKARAGEIPNFTGVSAPYEEPNSPFMKVETEMCSIEKATDLILQTLMEQKCLKE